MVEADAAIRRNEMTATVSEEVARYWSHGSLERAVRDGLIAMRGNLDNVRPEDLAAVDEFHMGGHEATAHLAAQMGLEPGMSLLDIGSGLGGPARFFARRYGCSVVGIDLTPEWVTVAEMLTGISGQTGRVSYRIGSATDMPFDGASFDAATLLHVGMNVPDKARLCAEAARVVKPGGVFAVYDVMRTGEGNLTFPLIWGDTASVSFVEDPATYRQALEAASFEVVTEEDRRASAIEFFRRVKERIAESGPPPLGFHILMRSEAPRKTANVIEALERGIIAPVEMICRRR